MNILVSGANGFIGRQIVATLQKAGHNVICCIRDKRQAQQFLPGLPYIISDFNKDIHINDWEPRLHNIDAVINCVGILQQRKGESITAIHQQAPIALFKACEKVGVKRVIQISAHGAESKAQTDYGLSKHVADEYLSKSKLDWVVLKPSLVFGSGSYGGTSLFRGLCALPGVLPIVGNGKQCFQPIHINDLAQSVLSLLEKEESLNYTLDAVGPECLSLEQLFKKLRTWLGFGRAWSIHIPLWLIFIMTFIADKFNRGPISTTAIKMLQSSREVDGKPFFQAIGFMPQGFTQGLQSMPSYVQDRWHARLYFLNPLLRISIAIVWLLSGIIPIFFIPLADNIELLAHLGITGISAYVVFYGLALVDIGLGIGTLIKWRLNLLASIQLLVIFVYTVIISIYLPSYWLEPFGSIIKNIPLFFATIVMMVLGEQR